MFDKSEVCQMYSDYNLGTIIANNSVLKFTTY